MAEHLAKRGVFAANFGNIVDAGLAEFFDEIFHNDGVINYPKATRDAPAGV